MTPVKLFKGNPLGNDTEEAASFLGSGFLISTSVLLTCKHVTDAADGSELYIHSNWDGGALRVDKKAVVPLGLDIVAIALPQCAPMTTVFPNVKSDIPITPGTHLKLHGFTRRDLAVEQHEAHVCAYDGNYDRILTDKTIGKGMSGGPATLNGAVIGVTQARDETHVYIIPLASVRNLVNQINRKIRTSVRCGTMTYGHSADPRYLAIVASLSRQLSPLDVGRTKGKWALLICSLLLLLVKAIISWAPAITSLNDVTRFDKLYDNNKWIAYAAPEVEITLLNDRARSCAVRVETNRKSVQTYNREVCASQNL